jgi:Transposase DDE domain
MVVPTAFDREACRRLPLAEAAWRLLDFVTQDEFLAGVFARHRGHSYEDLISFPLFVHLLGDALVQHHASAHQSFTRAQEEGDLTASLAAAYGKLARVPLGLSQGFLCEASRRLQQVFPAVAQPLPPSLAAFQVCAFDGKKIKYVALRLKPLRRLKGHILGGKLLVGLHLNTNLALAFQAHPDGEFGDQGLVEGLLAQLRASLPGPRLYVADRLFCDLNQPARLTAQGDHFVLRYSTKVRFHTDPNRPAQEGVDAEGRCWRQEWGWLGGAQDPRRCYVRRITLYRPDAEDVVVLTDLLDEVAYPAEEVLAIYRMRWGIEGCFQQITEVFDLGHLMGSTPQATVWQGAFCLLLYNVVLVLRGYLAEAQALAPEVISSEQLFTDVRRQLIAWEEVLTAEATVALLREPLPAPQLRARLQALLHGVWTPRWRKAPTKKKRPPPKPPPKQYVKGGHTSVYRLLLQERCQEKYKKTG